MNPLPLAFFPAARTARASSCRLSDKRWYLRDWHAHETLEINLVLRGSGQVLLEDRRYPLLPGHLVWLWPGQRHVPSEWSADMLLWIVEWQPGVPGAAEARPAAGTRRIRANPGSPFAAAWPRPPSNGSTGCSPPSPPCRARMRSIAASTLLFLRFGTNSWRPSRWRIAPRSIPSWRPSSACWAIPDQDLTQAQLARRVKTVALLSQRPVPEANRPDDPRLPQPAAPAGIFPPHPCASGNPPAAARPRFRLRQLCAVFPRLFRSPGCSPPVAAAPRPAPRPREMAARRQCRNAKSRPTSLAGTGRRDDPGPADGLT